MIDLGNISWNCSGMKIYMWNHKGCDSICCFGEWSPHLVSISGLMMGRGFRDILALGPSLYYVIIFLDFFWPPTHCTMSAWVKYWLSAKMAIFEPKPPSLFADIIKEWSLCSEGLPYRCHVFSSFKIVFSALLKVLQLQIYHEETQKWDFERKFTFRWLPNFRPDFFFY